MALKRYGMLLKKYLKALNPMKYRKLTIDGSLMDFLYDEEKYLYKMAQYNNMIDNMVEEYVRNEIMKIV